jgi:hypothetical protein
MTIRDIETGVPLEVVDVRSLTPDEIASAIHEAEMSGLHFGCTFVRFHEGTVAMVPDNQIDDYENA